MRNRVRLGTWLLLLPLWAPSAALNADVALRLVRRGLTARESDAVQHRHRRLTRRPLLPDECAATEAALEALSLHPAQLAHLLRSTPLEPLRAQAEAHSGRWCSYKRALCTCGAGAVPASADAEGAPAAPAVLGVDCEFKPLRFAAVDAAGAVHIDCAVLPDVPPPGGDPRRPKLPGVLSCDRQGLAMAPAAELRRRLLGLVAGGTTLVAHTPASDLRALGLAELEGSPSVVDVGSASLAEGERVVSLRRMAEEHLGLRIQRGGGPHCAIEDAYVALRLHRQLSARAET